MCVTLACTVARPNVKRLLIEPTGVTNLATLLQHILGIAGSTAVLLFVIAMARPASLRRARPALYGVALVGHTLLITFFALTPRPAEVHNFFEANLGQPYGTAYCMVFLGYLTVAMTISAWLFLSYSGRAARGSLRMGLRFLGAGAELGAIYTTWRIAHMLTRLSGGEFITDDDTTQFIADLIEYTAITLIVLGNTIPALGVLWHSTSSRRALRQVEPLWSSLTEAVPGVVLNKPVGRTPRLRLHRRLIEIWDVVLVLRAYAPAELIATARARSQAPDVPAAQQEAFEHALWIRTAWDTRLRGAEPIVDEPEGENRMGDADAEFDTEVRRVLALAQAYRDPRVAEFARTYQES